MATPAKTGNRPYSGRPSATRSSRKQGEATFDAPTPAERRRMDQEQAAPYKESYEAGRKAGHEEAAKKGSGSKKPTRKRPAPGARSARAASRQLQAPVRAQLTSGMALLGMSLGLVALYDVLTSVEAFTGALGGLKKGLEWLAAPDRTIPKRP